MDEKEIRRQVHKAGKVLSRMTWLAMTKNKPETDEEIDAVCERVFDEVLAAVPHAGVRFRLAFLHGYEGAAVAERD
jgi:hypothetical protein